MADKDPEIIEQATPEETDGITHGTRSTAVDDVDTAARAKAADIGNLTSPTADVEDATPAKLREFYKGEVKYGRVAPSQTGIETRLRADYEKAGKKASDAQITELARSILGR